MIIEHPYFHLIPSLCNEINVDVKICLSAADLVLAQFYFHTYCTIVQKRNILYPNLISYLLQVGKKR